MSGARGTIAAWGGGEAPSPLSGALGRWIAGGPGLAALRPGLSTTARFAGLGGR